MIWIIEEMLTKSCFKYQDANTKSPDETNTDNHTFIRKNNQIVAQKFRLR